MPWLAIALDRLGHEEEARRIFEEFRRDQPNVTIADWDDAYQRRNPVVLAQRERIHDSLRRLGVPD